MHRLNCKSNSALEERCGQGCNTSHTTKEKKTNAPYLPPLIFHIPLPLTPPICSLRVRTLSPLTPWQGTELEERLP